MLIPADCIRYGLCIWLDVPLFSICDAFIQHFVAHLYLIAEWKRYHCTHYARLIQTKFGVSDTQLNHLFMPFIFHCITLLTVSVCWKVNNMGSYCMLTSARLALSKWNQGRLMQLCMMNTIVFILWWYLLVLCPPRWLWEADHLLAGYSAGHTQGGPADYIWCWCLPPETARSSTSR